MGNPGMNSPGFIIKKCLLVLYSNPKIICCISSMPIQTSSYQYSSLDDSYYKKRYVGARRIEGFMEE
jgi:hypothetical protein